MLGKTMIKSALPLLVVGAMVLVYIGFRSLLTNERLAAQLRGQRLLAAVFLVKALGGDWAGASTVATSGK